MNRILLQTVLILVVCHAHAAGPFHPPCETEDETVRETQKKLRGCLDRTGACPKEQNAFQEATRKFRECKAGAGPAPQRDPQSTSSAAPLTFGAFIDTYYAYDFNRPSPPDRAYTTQPARHNEFNLNLAYLEAKLERDRVHGRLALQAGTSVQSNYAGEPAVGTISGPSLSRHVQEAYAGYRLGADTWIDAGIFLSHIGLESFISKDNPIYTRSLVADYSPYYETGVRLSTHFNDRFSGQLLILNGWQNISESNADKAIGTQLTYAFSPQFSATYNTFFGREASFRHFHDFIVKYSPSDLWSYALQADLGFQSGANWHGFALIAKRQLSSAVGVVGRIEEYSDPEHVLISTPPGTSFDAWGASLGLDVTLDDGVWWRNEVRGYWAKDEVFPSSSGFTQNNGVIVSSISAAF